MANKYGRRFLQSKKSGDSGVDGELTVHGGFDKERKDIWHKAVFSVNQNLYENCSAL